MAKSYNKNKSVLILSQAFMGRHLAKLHNGNLLMGFFLR